MPTDLEKCNFRLLVVDSDRKATSEGAEHVLYSIASNARLIKSGAKVDVAKSLVGGHGISFVVHSVGPKDYSDLPKSFVIGVSGKLEVISPLRKTLLEHFENEKFGARYVLTDEVSQDYAQRLYPLIYEVENILRGYLIQFMVTQIGPDWWNLTATSEQAQKAQQRKGNESFFGQLADSKAYLIDFGDLGRIVYEQSSGFRTRDEIVKKILELDERVEAITQLKTDLQSNYVKFFKESFRDKEFQAKWEFLEKIRNKVAHNSIISHEDFAHGEKVAKELVEIINEANSSVLSIDIEEQDRQAIKENVERSYAFTVISQKTFLHELESAESYFKGRAGFVGMHHFIQVWLGNQGYDYRASYEMADTLISADLVEKFEVHDGGPPTVAIRLTGQRSDRLMPGMIYAAGN